MMKIVLIALLVAIVALFGWLISSERNWTAVLNQQSFIVTGSKFGVSIGQSTEAATVTLRRANWQYIDTQSGGYCIRHHYPADTKILVFFDASWRKTTLCVGAKDQHVISIQWNAAPLSPEL